MIDGTTNRCTKANPCATINVGFLPVSIAVNPSTNQIYVADNLSSDVRVIDGLTGLTTTVGIGYNPNALAVNVSTNQVYVASTVTGNNGAVVVLDGVTNQLTSVSVGAHPSAVAVNPLTNRVYTADTNSNTLTAVDGDTNQFISVGSGGNPQAVGTNPVANVIYASNAGDNTVTVINGATDQTTTINVGTQPSALAVNPVSNQIYIADSMGNTATLIDGLTTEVNTLSVGVKPTAVAVNPVTNRAYVANTGASTVTAIDGTTGHTTTLQVGTNPGAIAVNPATDTIYVANSADNTVSVINGVTGQAATVNVGTTPSGVAVNPVTNQIYVANSGSNNVSVIDGASNAVTNVAVGTAPVAVAVNPATNRIFVANSGSGTVSIIRGATNDTASVTAGTSPIAVVVNPVTNHIYVANSGSNTVTVIDGLSNQTSTVPAGTNPSALSINPMLGQIYVTNSGSNNVTVIAEQRVGVLPLATAISALPGNVTVERAPTFTLSATGSYAPTNPPILGIRYQVDSWEGEWQAATSSGTGFTASTSSLALGPHVLYAVAENGQAAATTGLDQNIVGSISGYFFTVMQGQANTVVNSSLSSSSDGASVTLMASVEGVAPATGIPTGNVRFLDGATVLASGVALDGSGQASFTTSSLTPGTHSITAQYSGDVNFVSSSSTPFSQLVAHETSAVILTSDSNPSVFGNGVTFTAVVQAVAPATGIPTGTVSFFDGSAPLASGVTLNANGQASFGASSLTQGTHSITASYSGDANFAGSMSAPMNDIVNSPGLTLSLSKNSLSVTAGGAANFNVNVSSNGELLVPVTFACKGLPSDATCEFSPSSLSPSALPGKVMVTIGSSSVAKLSAPRHGIGGLWFGFALMGIVFAGLGRSYRTKVTVGVITMFVLVGMLLGCGSGGSKPAVVSPTTPTPTISSVTITATSGGLSAAANLSLTVMP